MRENQVMAKSRTMKRSLMVGAMATMGAFLSSGAQADYSLGLDAYRKAQYDVAVDLWERYARAGDVRAMKALGDYYSSCNPIVNSLGQTIEAEKLDEYEDVEALRWYILAASHDFKKQLRDDRKVTASERNAQIDAAACLPQLRGRMSDGEVSAAETLVSDSFERGTERDLYAIADMYLRGQGVQKDTGRAYELFLVAATRGASEAASKLQLIEEKKLLDKKGIELAERRASNWQPPLPDEHRGRTRQMTERERQLKELEALLRQNALEAVSDIDVIAIQGALKALGFYFGPLDGDAGSGTRKAIENFQYSQAKKLEDFTAEKGIKARTGTLSAQDTVDLIKLAASKADHGDSQNVYGLMFARGVGVLQDGDQAIKWLDKAADKNIATAHYALGVLYRDGTPGRNPVNQDKSKAALHFSKAAQLGYAPARRAWELLEFNPPSSVE